MNRLSRALTLSLTFAALGCDDLEPEGEAALPAPGGAPAGQGAPTPTGDEVRSAVIDATKEGVWMHLDLDTGAQEADPAAVSGWDLALSRFDVKLNGGVSGSRDVQATVVVGGSFDALTAAPSTGWDSDRDDGSDDNTKPEYFLSSGETGWWDYNPADHTLTPRAHVYVVRSDAGAFYKVEVRSYYNAASSPGYPELAWAKVTAPAGPMQARDPSAVDATTQASQTTHDAGPKPSVDGR